VYERVGGVYAIQANITGPAAEFTYAVLAYGASVDIDFTAADYRSVTLAGDIVFTTSNLAAPRAITVRIVGDGSIRNLSFPVGWTFLNLATPPATLAAGKTAVLSLTAFGATDADVIAAYAAQL
jgi:hypothetical protein